MFLQAGTDTPLNQGRFRSTKRPSASPAPSRRVLVRSRCGPA